MTLLRHQTQLVEFVVAKFKKPWKKIIFDYQAGWASGVVTYSAFSLRKRFFKTVLVEDVKMKKADREFLASLHIAMAESGHDWTSVVVEVFKDGRFTTKFGYNEEGLNVTSGKYDDLSKVL